LAAVTSFLPASACTSAVSRTARSKFLFNAILESRRRWGGHADEPGTQIKCNHETRKHEEDLTSSFVPSCSWLRAFVAAAAAAAAAESCSRARPADLRPIPGQNVLLITIDTLRADALSCYGGPALTPALDRLRRAGSGALDFAHAHAVMTLTSHASILTGTYPYQHGIRDNSGYRLPAHAAHIGDAARAGRLRNRGVRRRVSAAFALRPQSGLRRLRRSVSATPARRPSS